MTAARVTLVAFAKHASRQSFVPFASSVAYGKASTFATCASRVCAKSGPAPFTGQGFSSVSAALAASRRATVPHGTSFAASAAVPKRVSAGAVVPQYSSAFATAARAGFSAAAGKVTNAAAPHPLVAGGVFAEKAVGWWLIGGCAWVFSMVVLGGVTRLTRSGLAMTDWKFQWETPPMSDGDWDIEFRKYKESPEFKMTNKNMTVDEYKFIYWMEWSHRMWGRGLGVYFALPLVAFVLKGWITGKLGLRLVSFFGLGAAQGAIGWWMVKSGLVTDASNPLNAPRVSPYRLATHLLGAFVIYTAMLWTTFSVAFPSVGGGDGQKGLTEVSAAAIKNTRRKALPLSVLLAVTALSGAYVAGMDAGRAYNTFPLMDGRLVPKEYWAEYEKKGWRNFFENTAAVQFDHRALAVSTLLGTSLMWLTTRQVAPLLPKRANFALNATLGLVYAQVGLGVATLLYHVPVSLGAAHQANALLVFTAAVGLIHALRRGGHRGASSVLARSTSSGGGARVGSAVHAKGR